MIFYFQIFTNILFSNVCLGLDVKVYDINKK